MARFDVVSDQAPVQTLRPLRPSHGFFPPYSMWCESDRNAKTPCDIQGIVMIGGG